MFCIARQGGTDRGALDARGPVPRATPPVHVSDASASVGARRDGSEGHDKGGQAPRSDGADGEEAEVDTEDPDR